MRSTICSVFLLFLFSLNIQIFAQTEDIESIKIVSSWNGLGTPSNSKLEIKQKKGKFLAGGKVVERSLIAELLRQIENREKQTLASLEINQTWLDQNADKSLPDRLKKALPNEKRLFLDAFRNIKLVEKILPRIFGSWTDEKGTYHSNYSTDDYPEFEMTIRKSDGSVISFGSRSQTLFMFDNPRLGRAIAALLPKKFTNRERLNGDFLPYEIAGKIYDEIEEELERLETQNRVGVELTQLKDKYTVRTTAISGISSIDTGTPTSAYQTNEYRKWNFLSWNAELHRNDLPPNLFIGISLPYKDDKIVGFDLFQKNIDRIVARVVSVAWLSRAINERPETEFEIRFVEDRSLSRKARESFLEDLQVFGANALSRETLNGLEDFIFLQVSEKSRKSWSRWLVMPDGRTILWQINGEFALNWKPADFDSRMMYDRKDWVQTRAVILPDGQIESR
jgi:hypothetical protein